MADYITTEDVRFFLMDRSTEDNDLLLDLAYSDEEILQGMRGAARAYNSVPPYVDVVTADNLSAESNMFLHAIAMYLYMATNAKLKRNDIDYTAGGVGTNIVAKRIQHLDALIGFHKEEFEKEARTRKVVRNLDLSWGQVG
jgi:hypothetical protein